MTFRTRFAPSPTGPLHLGHAYSAILAHDIAHQNNGEFLLRIEDIDQSRARSEWVGKIFDDLEWLDLTWQEPVVFQSDRLEHYAWSLDKLWKDGLLFPCECNRKDILAAISAPQEGHPIHGPDGIIYPGTCTSKIRNHSEKRPNRVALRLDIEKIPVQPVNFHETGSGSNGETGRIVTPYSEFVSAIGSIVLARKDMGTSYHLSVVLDDAAQGISHVVRGQDLYEATKIHVLLQKTLGLPTPVYHHHPLIRDEHGKRLAKRDDARAISKYREDGYSPQDIRQMIGLAN